MKTFLCLLPLFCLTFKLISPIPDQVVLQDSSFSLDVAPYFSEPLQECRVVSPEFLSFDSSELEFKKAARLEYSELGERQYSAAVEHGENVWVLVRDLGVLIYTTATGSLLQHYFEERICGEYRSLALSLETAVLYNASEVVMLDTSSPLYPSLLGSFRPPYPLTSVVPLSASQLLLLSASSLSLFDFIPESGLFFSRSLSHFFNISSPSQVLAAVSTHSRLYILTDSEYGLRAVDLPDFLNLRIYPVTGERLLVSNGSLFIDTHSELDLKTEEIRPISSHPPQHPLLLAVINGVFFSRNATHWAAWDPEHRTLYSDSAADLIGITPVNHTSALILRSKSAVVASFAASKTTIHGVIPHANTAFTVEFTAKGRVSTLKVRFLLLVESPPLKVLLFLAMGSGVVIGLLCLGYVLYYAIVRGTRKEIHEMEMLTEESASGMQMNRDLGPMPQEEML